jgi:endonuclease/exonuclease/phosphatase family metal-dependent hydrolase
VLVGDFNMLRPDFKGASWNVKLRDMAARCVAAAAPDLALRDTVREMNKREAYQIVLDGGFRDADGKLKQPTAVSWFPTFGVDYVFDDEMALAYGLKVLPVVSASDHRPVRFRITAPGESDAYNVTHPKRKILKKRS